VSRRSPTNARYQKYQEPAGQTRKSAAAAKPSRKSADGSTSSASKSKASGGAGKARFDPQTPEFKRLRKQWWMLLLAGVVLVTASWGVRYIDKPASFLESGRIALGSNFSLSYGGVLASLTLGLAYACIFYALYLDFAKMRPMRMAASSGTQAKSSKPADKPAKADKTDDPDKVQDKDASTE
jgi:hypothetical protein